MKINASAFKSSITAKGQKGFTIFEVMVGLVIGLVLLSGLVATYVSSSRAQRNMSSDAEQIENGRLAVERLSEDLKLAGYYNTYYESSTGGPTTEPVPDPCDLSGTEAQIAERFLKALPYNVQAVRAADQATVADVSAWGAGGACGGLLAASNLVAGSDVIVVRRASTLPVIDVNTATAGAVSTDLTRGLIYIQTGGFLADVQIGGTAQLLNTAGGGVGTSPNGGNANLPARPLIQRNPDRVVVPGPVSKLVQRIYFVAPCSRGTGAGGVCTVNDIPLPTLKVIELNAAGGVPVLVMSALVEGIEAFTVDWGVDTTAGALTTANNMTGFVGDGQPDVWVKIPQVAGQTVVDEQLIWPNVVSARVNVLARNTKTEGVDYTDPKSYNMGLVSDAGVLYSYGDRTKRHFYGQVVRLENPARRREYPIN